MAERNPVAPHRALIIPKHRHLKWAALDPLEAGLMILCGVCMTGFTACVFFDVVTRTIGHPWLWLQQATTAFFAWGVFVGMAAATRRLDHIYLAEITRRMRGTKRLVIETLNRVVVLIVAVFMVYFGFKNAQNDMGSYRMPSLLPLAVYTAVVPLAGLLIVIFTIEQIVNGWKNGFEGREDDELGREAVE